MPIIAFPSESSEQEHRCALMPSNVKSYKRLGYDVYFEKGLGRLQDIKDQDYIDAGATLANSRAELLKKAQLVVSVRALPVADLPHVANKNIISFLDAFNNASYIDTLCEHKVTSFSMEMIPRSTRCQKMDALSSQASLAGYAMVAQALQHYKAILPMLMTAAGTIKPAKVFVIGAGVAGLQAIATAKRLGATVTAFDTRTVVAEQVKSLGAKFLDIDLGKTSQTAQGYAEALTEAQLQKQQAAQAQCIIESDIVITTAQLFGRKPPLLIDKSIVEQMKPGSVIVDMAALDGGNVEGTVPGEVVNLNGVTLIGTGNWTNSVSYNASQMYANNLQNLISEFTDSEGKQFIIDLTDDIQENAVITHHGEINNAMVRDVLSQKEQNTIQEEAS